MRILLVGNGGREHALAWKLSQSELLSALFVAPGNPGTAELAENVNIAVSDVQVLVDFSVRENIDLVVVGPEQPLALGLVDKLREAGVKAFGPIKAAALLESSKSFAKEIMQAAGVPTAGYRLVHDKHAANDYLKEIGIPVVIKADGLAAGKGVFVCHSAETATAAIDELYAVDAKRPVVIEQFLEGVEASYIVACGADQVVPLASAHDYKRIFDNDLGPNTGGMGTVSPTPNLTSEQEEWALERVIKPVLVELKKRGIIYTGFLYAGLMISESGQINVLEFNCRLGDPETQVILPRLDSDLLKILYNLTCGQTIDFEVCWSSDHCVCVVAASPGYPQTSSMGDVISGVEKLKLNLATRIFHAGTATDSLGNLVTNGGRVLNVVGQGADHETARKQAYEALQQIKFDGMQYRHDIGLPR